jgi:hypothetical protein
MDLDDVGGIDIVGADDMLELLDIVGAQEGQQLSFKNVEHFLKRLKSAKAKKLTRKLAMLSKAQQVPQVLLGFDSGHAGAAAIAAAAGATITTQPTVDLRITDMIVDATFAADFLITSIDIGRLNLMAGAQGLPATAFVSGVQRPPIEAPRLPAGTDASVAVTNISGQARRLIGMFVGIDLSQEREAWRDVA